MCKISFWVIIIIIITVLSTFVKEGKETVVTRDVPKSKRFRPQLFQKKTFPSFSFIKSETPGKLGSVDERKRHSRTFVGICYSFVYPYRHKVILN